MSPASALAAGAATTIFLLLMRVPVAVAVGSVALAGIYNSIGLSGMESIVKSIPYNFIAHWTLSAIPMFIFMGNVAAKAGLTSDLYNAARVWTSRMPGGLAVASIGGAAGFSTITGSSIACAASIGRIAVPEMLARRYDPGLATGTVAAAGLLGSLIPPSVILMLYGLFAEVSIAKLFVAAIIPGIITAILYVAMVVGRVTLNPSLAPREQSRFTWAERFGAMRSLGPVIAVVIGVVGGLILGVFSPTEAGAVGAFLTVSVVFIQRRVTVKQVLEAAIECAHVCASIFIIAICAALLQRFLTLSGTTALLGTFINDLGFGPVGVIIITAAVYLVLGMFLDSIGIMLVTLPVLLPIFAATGIDLIWAGILIAKLLEIGLITPPVGLNVFVINSVVGEQVKLTTIFRGVSWFIALEMVILAILISWPAISTWLPSLMN